MKPNIQLLKECRELMKSNYDTLPPSDEPRFTTQQTSGIFDCGNEDAMVKLNLLMVMSVLRKDYLFPELFPDGKLSADGAYLYQKIKVLLESIGLVILDLGYHGTKHNGLKMYGWRSDITPCSNVTKLDTFDKNIVVGLLEWVRTGGVYE